MVALPPGAVHQRYYAHTASGPEGEPLPEASGQWQPLADHLCSVAQLAGMFAAPFGARGQARVAGLLHDLGKYAQRFQARLRNPSVHGINHWSAGALQSELCAAPLAAYAVEGHHTGLPAAADLRQRLLCLPDSARRAEITGCAESVGDLFERARAEGIAPRPGEKFSETGFAAAQLCRMVFSALVDADFLDTERHFDPEAAQQRSAPPLQEAGALAILRDYLGGLPSGAPMSRLRDALLQDCLSAAEQPPGLFTLTAPTGSGKTLASLAFALRHAELHNAALPPADPGRLTRVVVVIPYTSIIEQTAAVFRGVFEPHFGPDYVLEHHGAVAPAPGTRVGEDEGDRERRRRLAAENWSAPIVVTTSVQFFESLLSSRPTACRKLHNLARAVLIFDEVQTLPARLVPSLLSSVKLLTGPRYGASAVFMTATQPAFAAARPALPYGWQPREIGRASAAAASAANARVRVELPKPGEALDWPALAARLCAHAQALCVLNTTKQARDLYRLLPAESRYHLSARMCPAHRQEVLRTIRRRLAERQPCRLASTQVIEAGVDVDFPVAFRALGPLDSIIQTAGRCNREGRLTAPAPLTVFRPADSATPPGAYRTAAALTESFLARRPDAERRLEDAAFYREYFSELYAAVGRESAEADPAFAASEKFDFPAAADACRIIPETTHSVLVRWGDGERLIERARRRGHLDPSDRRLAQRYSVNLPWSASGSAQALGYTAEAGGGVWYWNSEYDPALGVCHAEADNFIA